MDWPRTVDPAVGQVPRKVHSLSPPFVPGQSPAYPCRPAVAMEPLDRNEPLQERPQRPLGIPLPWPVNRGVGRMDAVEVEPARPATARGDRIETLGDAERPGGPERFPESEESRFNRGCEGSRRGQ